MKRYQLLQTFALFLGLVLALPAWAAAQTVVVKFNLSYMYSEYGKVSATANGEPIESGTRVNKGSTVVLTATPNPGYTAEWSNVADIPGVSFNEDKSVVTITDIQTPVSAQLKFRAIVYKATFAVAEGFESFGTLTGAWISPYTGNPVAMESGARELNIDDDLTFTATPNPGYKVDMWTLNGTPVTEGLSADKLTYSLKVTDNVDVKVSFKEDVAEQFTVKFIVKKFQESRGSVSATANGEEITTGSKVDGGSTVVLTATANPGYVASWSGVADHAGVSYNEDKSVVTIPNLAAAVNATATFTQVTYKATYSVAEVSKDMGTLAGFWISSTTGNLVEMASGARELSVGDKLSFTATPNEGYVVDSWTVNGNPVTENLSADKLTFTPTVEGNMDVQVVFKEEVKEQFTVKFIVKQFQESRGSVSATANGEEITTGSKVDGGSTVVLTATANPGYVASWSGVADHAGVSYNEDKSVVTIPNLAAAVNATATFTQITYKATYSVAEGSQDFGTLAGFWISSSTGNPVEMASGARELSVGDKLSFTATPKEGYEVDAWIIDGNPVTEGVSEDKLTLSVTVAGNMDVQVSFKAKEAVTPDPDDEEKTCQVTVRIGAFNEDRGALKITADGTEIQSGDWVAPGTEIIITAIPKEGYQTSYWQGVKDLPGATISEDNNTATIPSIEQSIDVIVKFSQKEYLVTYQVAKGSEEKGTLEGFYINQGGTRSKFESGAMEPHGYKLVFVATPVEGCEVDSWTVNEEPATAEMLSEDGTELSVDLTAQLLVSVSFKGNIGVSTITVAPVKAYLQGQLLIVEGLSADAVVALYDAAGTLVKSVAYGQGVSLQNVASGAYIAVVNGQAIKFVK